ncbi:two-component sensor histidine kinase [Streptacidiphilus sp. PB12-B1b]|nr:two-component sensor histidine kinase [Streptacidiphilus sp. PB12-B1b]
MVVALTAAFAFRSHPRPGLSGERLVVSLALAGCLLALVPSAWGRGPRRSVTTTVVLPVLLGVFGTALSALQANSMMEIPVSAAVGMLCARMPLRPALWLSAPLTVAVALAAAGVGSHRVSVEAGLASVLLCVVLGASSAFARQARLGQDRTELLLAELEDSREAGARAAAVAERTRIAQELHDVLAQSLSALAVQLEGARKLAERDQVDPQLQQLIVRGGELTREGLSDARQAVAALRGDRLPTVDQLTALIDRCRRDLALPITLSVSGEPRTPTPEAGLALYRGAQEALTNVARYAAGSPTAVALRYTAGATTLTVSDRGTAAAGGAEAGHVAAGGAGAATITPPARSWTGGGNGLRGMRERIERVGGRIQAGPTAEGWTVEMEIPA